MTRTVLRLLTVTITLLMAEAARAAEVKITPDVVYGHKDGMALTMDALQPTDANGAAVIFVMSGGWYSNWIAPQQMQPACQPLLNKGFTVFVVRHGSAPRYHILEAVEDMRRSVRYLRLHAADWKIDPERLGVFGGSAGGHLSLVLGTTADDGQSDSPDQVLQQSDRVAAVVALYPPTDLRTWVTDPPKAIKDVAALKPPLSFDPTKAADVSPLLHVSSASAPTLLIHGDKDELVPIEHSNNIYEAFQKENVSSELLVIEGAAHGFQGKDQARVVAAMVDWFEKHLAAKEE